MFKFYFDNNLVDDPINWADFTETIERDDLIKGLLPKYELKLTFTGGGYEYLYNIRRTNGFCNLVDFRVEYACNENDSYQIILQGYIPISRCSFNLNRCVVDCDVLDDNYGARIYNNKSIKTSFSNKSKNGETIPSAALTLLVPFDCGTGTYGSTADARNAVSIYEAFEFLIAWMTDGTVGFQSSFLADTENVGCLITGHQLRVIGSNQYPILSFDQLFKEVDRKYNIGFTVIDVSGQKKIVIENIDYFFNTTVSTNITAIPDLLESFSPEKLYSGVKLGGTIATYDSAIHNFTPRQFIGFDVEEYGFMGVCNIDNQLDLSADFLFDTNIIEELTVTNTTNESYNKDVFIVKGTYSGGYYYADKSALASGGFMYNKAFTNEYASQAFRIYGDTVLYTGLTSNNFRAERTNYDETNPTGANFPHAPTGYADVTHNDLDPTFKTTTVFQVYNNDSTPPNVNSGGNYNNGNGRYTAPLDGSYFFEMDSLIRIFSEFEVLGTQGIPRETRFTLTFNHYDSGGGVINTFSSTFPDTSGTTLADMQSRYSGVYAFHNEAYIYMTATDYVRTSVTVDSVANSFGDWLWCNVTNGSTFMTLATPSGGGVFQEGDSDTYMVSKLQFEYPISNERYADLKADLTKAITATHDGQLINTAWIRRVERNLSTGQTNFELITNIDNTK